MTLKHPQQHEPENIKHKFSYIFLIYRKALEKLEDFENIYSKAVAQFALFISLFVSTTPLKFEKRR